MKAMHGMKKERKEEGKGQVMAKKARMSDKEPKAKAPGKPMRAGKRK